MMILRCVSRYKDGVEAKSFRVSPVRYWLQLVETNHEEQHFHEC